MSVKAKLKIVLQADKVVVAESEDPNLWQEVFSAINSGNSQISEQENNGNNGQKGLSETSLSGGKTINSIDLFAKEVGVTKEQIEGACSPQNEAPYIHLDAHYWEAIKTNMPQRGPSAVSPVALAGTLLCIWFKHAGIEGNPTVKQCQEVLKTIDLRDTNAARSLKNTEWLQARANGIVINPVQRTRALQLIRAFCCKTTIAANGK